MNKEIKEILDYFKKYVNDKYETYTVVDIHTQNLRTLINYITNLQERNEKANVLLDEMLERAYIDEEYIMYDYSTSELLEVKQALQGEDKDE